MRFSRKYSSLLVVAALLGLRPAVSFAQGDAGIQHIRPMDQRGLNIFEPPKADTTKFTGLHTSWGAAFTQDFQNFTHQNTATPNLVNGVNANALMPIGPGFNNAMANLYMNTQLAKGIRVQLTAYLSTRHHNEAWVKDGYFLIDDSPFDVPELNMLMQYLTLRVGHFEINYGDEHFRRTDGGNALDNAFIGNPIIDAFTTEIGAEAYLRSNGYMLMGAITGGEVRGTVETPSKRAPAFYGKAGYDKQLNKDLRFRLTGSLFSQARSANNTLIGGDRAGSHYFDVMENTASTTTANAWSGTINPGMRNDIHALAVNPFIKYQGLELFGDAERFRGSSATEVSDRTWTQYDGQAVYRFLPNEQAYVGYRYNTAKGQLTGITNDVSVNRWSVGGGLFVTRNVLAKFEYTNQTYNNFPLTDIRSGGLFKGFMLEGVVAF
ncbi:MAG TPA: hypothetical protein VNE60_09495 [Gemmatimonadaceae bacterium]|nr:hypothetical protein [Gemmatimonadaceae bacterium]